MVLGISTCWWSTSDLRDRGLVKEILDLGFKGVELEYRINESFYRELKSEIKRSLTVLSIHNFFPKPEDLKNMSGSGDLFLLSSIDRDERLSAVKYSTRTIEHANELEARAVVFHLGRVDMPDPKAEFFRLYETGKIGEAEGLAFIEEQRQIRKNKQQKNLDAALFCLEKLNRVAEKKGIFLGIENRYYFHEIPNFEEFAIIMNEFEGGNIRYWHDVGHASALEKLGICRQKDLLKTYSENMIGIHLHDIKGLDDHLAPGQGDMDFEEIRPFIKPNIIKVLEVQSGVERDDLLKGAEILKGMDLG
jgi:sugar phosphate isomerase/epimerase